MTLPNFLILGASHAGTTSLYRWLGEHPDVFMSREKELRYYWDEVRPANRSEFRVTTREGYEEWFDEGAAAPARGEASPQYLYSPTAPDRILHDLPGVRLIVTLRHPAERAWSHWRYDVYRKGHLRSGRRGIRPGTDWYDESLYAEGLLRYLARFPPEQIRIILFDDLTARPQETVAGLLEFLGVDPAAPIDTSAGHNRSLEPRSRLLNSLFVELIHYAVVSRRWRMMKTLRRIRDGFSRQPRPMPPDVRSRLVEAFRPDVLATQELIGRDLSAWLR